MPEQPTSTKPKPAETTIACADCGQTMVVRMNRERQSEFLGCSQYPTCTNTQPIPEWLRLKKAGAAMLPGMEV